MKSWMLVVLLSVGTPAWASHFMSCDVEAEVVEVQNLARLDGQATFREGMEDYEQIVRLKVTAVNVDAKASLPGRCIPEGTETTLHVKQDQVGDYKQGDTLKFHYNNVGDALGSRITWTLR